MVTRKDIYVCDVCNLFESSDRQEAKNHEQIPITSHEGLDGLITKGKDRKGKEVYLVITKTGFYDEKHNTLSSSKILTKDLREPKESPIVKKVNNQLRNSMNGFDASIIVKYDLHYPRGEDEMRKCKELSKKEFKDITQRLKEKYPELYKETVFKREYFTYEDLEKKTIVSSP